MIHQINKIFDQRDEHGVDCNVWMQMYGKVCYEVFKNTTIQTCFLINNSFPSNLDDRNLFREHLATMLENPRKEHLP